MAEGQAELQHAHQQQHEHRHEDRELDQALALRAPPLRAGCRRAPALATEGGHRTGSMRIVLDWTIVVDPPPPPMKLASGVTQLWV